MQFKRQRMGDQKMTKEQQKKRKALGIWSYDGGNKPGPKVPPTVTPKKAKVGVEGGQTVYSSQKTQENHKVADTANPKETQKTSVDTNTAVANGKAIASESAISQFQLVTEVNKASQVTFSESSKNDSWRSSPDDSGRSSRNTGSPSRRLFTHVAPSALSRQTSARRSESRGRPKSSVHKEEAVLSKPPNKKVEKNARQSAAF